MRKYDFGIFLSIVFYISLVALFGGVVESSASSISGEYYIVYNHVGKSMSEAKDTATMVKMSGGAGYVIEKKDKYYVALCAYQNEADAKAVTNKNQGSDVMKYEIGFDVGSEEEGFKKEVFYIANKLYDLALKYETKTITNEEVKVEVSIMKKRLEDRFSSEDSVFSEKLYFYLASLDNIIKASDSNLCWILRYEQIKFIVNC